MGKNSFPFQPGNLKQDLMDRIDHNAKTGEQKKKLRIGTAICIASIFLATGAFCYFIFAIMSYLSLINIVGCVASMLAMIASIIFATIRLRRLQSEYFAEAACAAQEYVSELSRKTKDKYQ